MFYEVPENLIKLEQSLRKMRNDQRQLISEREKLAADTKDSSPKKDRITLEINRIETAAKQTEEVIYNILKKLRTNQP